MKASANRDRDDIEKTLTPFLQSLIELQELAENTHKEENTILQEQITEMQKDNIQLQYLITVSNKKLEKLLTEVGTYQQ